MADAAEGTSRWHCGDGGRGKILTAVNALSVPGIASRLNQKNQTRNQTMARPPNWIRAENAACGWLPSLRDYWREINRQEREAQGQEREERKTRDKRRRKCQCKAYPWPHRPGGGLCCWPDPPVECWK